jgi:hypothetical protein
MCSTLVTGRDTRFCVRSEFLLGNIPRLLASGLVPINALVLIELGANLLDGWQPGNKGWYRPVRVRESRQFFLLNTCWTVDCKGGYFGATEEHVTPTNKKRSVRTGQGELANRCNGDDPRPPRNTSEHLRSALYNSQHMRLRKPRRGK